jgi:hypothetical protein
MVGGLARPLLQECRLRLLLFREKARKSMATPNHVIDSVKRRLMAAKTRHADTHSKNTGSGNMFASLGHPYAVAQLLKASLLTLIDAIIRRHFLT